MSVLKDPYGCYLEGRSPGARGGKWRAQGGAVVLAQMGGDGADGEKWSDPPIF